MQIENQTPAIAPLTSQAGKQIDIIEQLEALAKKGSVVKIGSTWGGLGSEGYISIEKSDDAVRVEYRSSKNHHDPKSGPALGASFSKATGDRGATWRRNVVIYDVQGPEADKIAEQVRLYVKRAYAYNCKPH